MITLYSVTCPRCSQEYATTEAPNGDFIDICEDCFHLDFANNIDWQSAYYSL